MNSNNEQAKIIEEPGDFFVDIDREAPTFDNARLEYGDSGDASWFTIADVVGWLLIAAVLWAAYTIAMIGWGFLEDAKNSASEFIEEFGTKFEELAPVDTGYVDELEALQSRVDRIEPGTATSPAELVDSTETGAAESPQQNVATPSGPDGYSLSSLGKYLREQILTDARSGRTSGKKRKKQENTAGSKQKHTDVQEKAATGKTEKGERPSLRF